GRPASGGALLLASLALLLALLGHSSVVLLALAAVLLDFAVQCHLVLSQHEIYGLHADARARINTVFMTTVFTGGALSSAVTGAMHSAYAWTGACVLGMTLPFLALLLWAHGMRTARRSRPRPPVAAHQPHTDPVHQPADRK
ncbi:MFS transporter, partial [Micromonospora parva]